MEFYVIKIAPGCPGSEKIPHFWASWSHTPYDNRRFLVMNLLVSELCLHNIHHHRSSFSFQFERWRTVRITSAYIHISHFLLSDSDVNIEIKMFSLQIEREEKKNNNSNNNNIGTRKNCTLRRLFNARQAAAETVLAAILHITNASIYLHLPYRASMFSHFT